MAFVSSSTGSKHVQSLTAVTALEICINGGICMLGIVCLVLRRPALRQATKSFRPCTKASVNQTKSCVTQLGHRWQRVHSVSVERVSVPTATLKMTEI